MDAAAWSHTQAQTSCALLAVVSKQLRGLGEHTCSCPSCVGWNPAEMQAVNVAHRSHAHSMGIDAHAHAVLAFACKQCVVPVGFPVTYPDCPCVSVAELWIVQSDVAGSLGAVQYH